MRPRKPTDSPFHAPSRTWTQIASLLSTFGIGPDRVAAAAILFTRAADSEADSGLEVLEAALGDRDTAAWRKALGWYWGLTFSNPTGAWKCV